MAKTRSNTTRTESSVPPQHHAHARAATRGPTPRWQHESYARDTNGGDQNAVGSADDDDIFSYEPNDYDDGRFPSYSDSDDDMLAKPPHDSMWGSRSKGRAVAFLKATSTDILT